MNREIKLRGYSITDKTWVYGSLNAYSDGTFLITNFEGTRSWSVYPQSVGQYTGLKGNKNTPVYDGDIVEIEDNEGQKCPPYVIQWSERYFNIIGACIDGMDNMMLDEFEYCNVIGNIYENPNLLTP